jgi:uncharacterized protein YfdQ (DUF2303 family)
MDHLDVTAISTAVELGQRLAAPNKVDGVPFVIVPCEHEVKYLDEYMEFPHRKKARVSMVDPGSFVSYFNSFRDESSLVFADLKSETITGIIDYHHASSERTARWRDHVVSFKPMRTPEWDTWIAKNGQKFSQVGFAEFIENNLPDIVEPPGAAMLEVARDLQAKTDVQFASAISLANGQKQFTYQETTAGTVGKGKMDVPESFTIRLRIYQGGDTVSVTARLRFRIQEGKLTFWYDLLRPQKFQEDAFNSFVREIVKGTSTEVLIGSAS